MYTRKQNRRDKKNKRNKKKNHTKKMGGSITDNLILFLMNMKNAFTGKIANSFYNIFKLVGENITYMIKQLYDFILYLWKDISTKGIKSSLLRTILLIFGIIISFYVVGAGLTSTGIINIFGNDGIVSGWISTNIMNINIFNIIGGLFMAVTQELGNFVNFIEYLFGFEYNTTTPTTIISITYTILISGAISLVMCFLNEFFINETRVMKIIKKKGNLPIDEIKKLYNEEIEKENEHYDKAVDRKNKFKEELQKVLEENRELNKKLKTTTLLITELDKINTDNLYRKKIDDLRQEKIEISNQLKTNERNKQYIKDIIANLEGTQLEMNEIKKAEIKLFEAKEKLEKLEKTFDKTDEFNKNVKNVKKEIQLAEDKIESLERAKIINEIKNTKELYQPLEQVSNENKIKSIYADIDKEINTIYNEIIEKSNSEEMNILGSNDKEKIKLLFSKYIIETILGKNKGQYKVQSDYGENINEIDTETIYQLFQKTLVTKNELTDKLIKINLKLGYKQYNHTDESNYRTKELIINSVLADLKEKYNYDSIRMTKSLQDTIVNIIRQNIQNRQSNTEVNTKSILLNYSDEAKQEVFDIVKNYMLMKFPEWNDILIKNPVFDYISDTAGNIGGFFNYYRYRIPNYFGYRLENEGQLGGGGLTTNESKKIPISERVQKISTKKLLKTFNSIPKENIDKVREQYPVQFYMGMITGFVKETEGGYEFTEQGIKSLKNILQQTTNLIDKNCQKGESCAKSIKNHSSNKKHNKTQKSSEELSYQDAVELKDVLDSLNFVHRASIHSVVRENTEDIKNGGRGRGKEKGGRGKGKVTDVEKTVTHLKTEDVSWLKEKHPEEYEAAKKYGLVNETHEMTNLFSKIIQDSGKINGIDIYAEYYKDIPPQ